MSATSDLVREFGFVPEHVMGEALLLAMARGLCFGSDKSAARRVKAALIQVSCGNACVFGSVAGMSTTGPCHCLDWLSPEMRRQARAVIREAVATEAP